MKLLSPEEFIKEIYEIAEDIKYVDENVALELEKRTGRKWITLKHKYNEDDYIHRKNEYEVYKHYVEAYMLGLITEEHLNRIMVLLNIEDL